MKLTKYSWLLGLALIFFTFSCSKENITETGIDLPETPETEVVTTNPILGFSVNSEDGMVLECFTINYPFDLVDEEGVTYTISADADLEILEDETTIIVDFVYPLTITYEDGETATIDDADALGEAFISCIPDGGWTGGQFPAYLVDFETSCYEFVYPVTLVNEEGTETVVNNEEEFTAALTTEVQFFVFPVTLVDEEGEETVVNDIDEFFNALFACGGYDNDGEWDWENGFEYIGCYTVEFPLDIVLADGTTTTVADHMELCDIMIEGNFAGYAFPMTLTGPEGEEVVVNSQEELDAAIEDCPGWGGSFDPSFELLFNLYGFSFETDGCFTIDFPIEIYFDEDGTEVTTVNNQDEFDAVMTGTNFPVGMNVPVSITLEDGTSVEINNSEELFAATIDCFGGGGGGGGGFDNSVEVLITLWLVNQETEDCFTINFPITANLDPEGTESVVINNQEELDAMFNDGEQFPFSVELPLSVTLANGDVVEANDIEDIFGIAENCE